MFQIQQLWSYGELDILTKIFFFSRKMTTVACCEEESWRVWISRWWEKRGWRRLGYGWVAVQVEGDETMISCQFCIRWTTELCSTLFVEVAKIKHFLFTFIDGDELARNDISVRRSSCKLMTTPVRHHWLVWCLNFLHYNKKRVFLRDIFTFRLVFPTHLVCLGGNNRVECAICSDEE